KFTEKGAYLIVDRGYHKWRCLMSLFKASSTQAQLKWSSWLESVRKDVECSFGRQKGRFRILKLPMLHGASSNRPREKTNKMFFTCFILENSMMVLAHRGLLWTGRV
ncbi:unnamed protein product, partial [Discosporangium mesarthrocarpum]